MPARSGTFRFTELTKIINNQSIKKVNYLTSFSIFLIFGFTAISTMLCAQTEFALNEGLTIDTVDSDLSGWVTWWGHPNKTYFIQFSDDLVSWHFAPIIAKGNNTALSWAFSEDGNRIFFRLKYTDQFILNPLDEDLDGDSVSNMDELLEQTDPFQSIDGNNNGLPDDWERFYAVTDSLSDLEQPSGDGLINETEALIGTHPEKNYQAIQQLEIFNTTAQ